MHDRAKIIAKTPEAKKSGSVQIRKSEFNHPIASPINCILSLQRTIGNQASQGLFKSGAIQAKLKIGQPNDIYEQELQVQPLEEEMRMKGVPGGSPEVSSCTPAAGIPSTSCSAYIRNSWWLPMAYVHNATCACRVTPNSPTAKCVRKSLQDRLAATPAWLKVVAFGQKPNDNPANPIQYAAYQVFVQTSLTPRIYRDHVAAYSSCCCPSGPAAYPAWVGVTSVPTSCSAVGWSIRQFGSCHGTPGRW